MVFSFSGSLSSRLAIFHVRIPFTNLEGLLESEYKVGGWRGAATILGFIEAKEGSVRRKIADKLIISETLVSKHEDGLEKMFEDNYAFLSKAEAVFYFANDKCAVMEI